MTTAFYRENKGKREQCSYVLLLNCLMLSSTIKEIIFKDLSRDRFFLGRDTGANGGRKGVIQRSAAVESPKIKAALLTGHLLAAFSNAAISSTSETKQANRSQPTSHRYIKQPGHKCDSFTLLCPDKTTLQLCENNSLKELLSPIKVTQHTTSIKACVEDMQAEIQGTDWHKNKYFLK